MVLQKVLMATEVEQREVMFWFNFLLCGRYMKNKKQKQQNNRNSTIKVLFFQHVQVYIQICLPQFST